MAEQSRRTRPRRLCGAGAVLAACALAQSLCFPVAVIAHQIGPNYDSVVRRMSPEVRGLTAVVDKGEGDLRLTNDSGREVVVRGYENEPYARLDGDGRVFVNQRSPARFLNLDIYANVDVPAGASAKAKPDWKLVGRGGAYAWHDHRIHWMSPKPPASVAGVDRRTKIFDWKVPITVAGHRGEISGTLYWIPEPKASTFVSVIVFAVSALVVVVCGTIFCRRSPDGADESPDGDGGREVW